MVHTLWADEFGICIHAMNKFRFYEILEGIHDEEVLIMIF